MKKRSRKEVAKKRNYQKKSKERKTQKQDNEFREILFKKFDKVSPPLLTPEVKLSNNKFRGSIIEELAIADLTEQRRSYKRLLFRRYSL